MAAPIASLLSRKIVKQHHTGFSNRKLFLDFINLKAALKQVSTDMQSGPKNENQSLFVSNFIKFQPIFKILLLMKRVKMSNKNHVTSPVTF